MQTKRLIGAALLLGSFFLVGCGKTTTNTDSTSSSGDNTGSSGTSSDGTTDSSNPAEGGQSSDGTEFSKAELDAKFNATQDANKSVEEAQNVDDDINGAASTATPSGL